MYHNDLRLAFSRCLQSCNRHGSRGAYMPQVVSHPLSPSCSYPKLVKVANLSLQSLLPRALPSYTPFRPSEGPLGRSPTTIQKLIRRVRYQFYSTVRYQVRCTVFENHNYAIKSIYNYDMIVTVIALRIIT